MFELIHSPSQEYKKLEEGYKHERKWQRINVEAGTYMSLGAIAEQYGIHANRLRALGSAKVYAEKCVAMGGDWVKLEHMSEQLMFLFLRAARGLYNLLCF